MRCYNCMKEQKSFSKYCPYCGCETCKSNSPHQLAAGTVLKNRYLIGNAIGEGGFGITYVGFDLNLELKTAVKEYFPAGCAGRFNERSNEVSLNHTNDNEFYSNGKERFLKEAKNIAMFSSENGIVDVRDFFTENNTAYIVMEFLNGKTLGEYINENGIFSSEEIFRLMLPLMGTLQIMHDEGVIHRDISPGNIMYLNSGELKLMDFGSARQFSANEAKTMSILLKPGYAPYEQYSRKSKQGPWTDVYGLCATIYKCITGITPLDSLDRSVIDELKKPSELGVDISPALEKALLSGLEVSAASRCQSMAELAEKVTAALYPEPSGEAPAKKRKRLPLAAIAGLSAVLLVSGLLLVIFFFNNSGSNENNTIPAFESYSSSAAKATDSTDIISSVTDKSNEEVIPENVVGYFYDYAQEVLEKQGFKVDDSQSEYSDEYDEDFVISMSPDSSSPVKKGSTIKLVISKGLKTSVPTTKAANVCSVTFLNHDGSVIETQLVEYGKAAKAPADPVKPSDEYYDYKFKCWGLDFSNVTSDMIIAPVYEPILKPEYAH